MLRIIRGRSSAGSGCVLSDFGESSFDDTVSDRDTLSDCSVRYFCESPTGCVAQETSITSSSTGITNMEKVREAKPDDIIPICGEDGDNGVQPNFENSLMTTSIDNESIVFQSASQRQGESVDRVL